MSNIADTDLGLRIIYTPEHVDEKHLINIIAIHGIGAHPKKTWTKKVFTDGVLTREHNWLIDPHMLPKEVPNMRVWTFGYDSAWFGIDSVNTSLTGISKRLLSALGREKLTEQPLIFVAHCFGGLVVLKTLLLAEDRPDNNSPTLDLFKYTYGIVFFATPFQGTDPQFTERLVEGAQKVEPVVLDDRWLLDILRKGNDTLGELKEGFLRKIPRHKRPQVACISEEKVSDIGPIFKSRCIYNLVVDKDSACLALRSDKPTIISHSRARDHFNVSKFTSDTDEDYRIVAEKLKEFAEDAMPTVDRQIIGKQITALQKQSDLPPDVPTFDPAGWKETPFQPFPTKHEIKETKVVVPMFKTSFHIAGLSPDCTLMLLLNRKLAQVFRPQDDLKIPVLELKPSRSESPYEKGTLGDHVLAITTQYGCSLWNLDSPSPEAKKTIPYPSEECWNLDCVAIHEAKGLVMVAIGVWRAQSNSRCGRVDLYVLDKDNLDTVQQMRMSAEFLDSPKLLNFASNGSLLMCTTSERNRILIWNLDGPSGMEPMSQTARDYTGGSDGITSALIWLSPGGNPYMLCTTSPRAQRARHKGEWTFLAPAGDPFPEDASHCFHCFHHVQRTKHYALHACAIPPQGNIVALLDKTGKLCLVPLRADNRGGITSDVLKDLIEIKEWNLGENDYHMVAIRFDPEGKRLVGVNSHGAIRVLDFIEQSVPAATPLLMGPGMRTLTRAQTLVAPGEHYKTNSWSTTDGTI